MEKKVIFDFLTIEMPDKKRTFKSILEESLQMGEEKLNRTVDGETLRVMHLKRLNDRYCGNLVRIREGILPGRTSYKAGPVKKN